MLTTGPCPECRLGFDRVLPAVIASMAAQFHHQRARVAWHRRYARGIALHLLTRGTRHRVRARGSWHDESLTQQLSWCVTIPAGSLRRLRATLDAIPLSG